MEAGIEAKQKIVAKVCAQTVLGAASRILVPGVYESLLFEMA